MLPPALAERYQRLSRLGAGGMGTVHLARDRELGREVAIKLAHRPDDPRTVERFRREARAMASIEHPHVARLLDFGEAGEQLFMVQEYIPGTPPGPRTPDPVGAMLDVADALEALHQAGVLHRDLKPSNLVQRDDGSLVLIDFGLARQEDETALTATGVVVGTPFALSPEILRGEPASPASDFYAWGATLYVLLEGSSPVPHDKLADWAVHGDLKLRWRRTPEGAVERRLVARCMAHDPARRPTTRKQLEAIAAGGEVDPTAPTQVLPVAEVAASTGANAPVVPAPAPARRTPWVLGMVGVVLLGAASHALRAPAPAPPAPPAASEAPAGPGPEAQALDRAAGDLARMFGWEEAGTERDPAWIRDPTVRAHLTQLGDVRLPTKLRRTREAAVAWLRRARSDSWRTPQGATRLQAEVVGTLLYALGLYRGIQAVHGTDAVAFFESGTAAATRESLGLDHAEMRELSRATILELEAATEGEARLAFEAFAVGLAPRPARPGLVGELIAALEAEPPSPLRPVLGMALDYANLHVDSLEELPCEDRVRAADFRSRYYAAPVPGLTPRDLWRRRMRALSLEIKLDRACGGRVEQDRTPAVRAYLDAIQAEGGTAPALVGLGLVEARTSATRMHLLFEDPHPWLQRQMARLPDLLGRYPPPPPEADP